jgi:hypothetical protein
MVREAALRKAKTMTNQEIIASFANDFEGTEDGFISADDTASGFFNESVEIGEDGNIWHFNCNCWVSDDRLGDFVAWLKENNHL